MEELQQRLRDLESQKSVLFESGAADQVEVGRINAEIRAIELQIAKLQEEQQLIDTVESMKDQVFEEISETVLGRNYNELFADDEANKLIHGDIMQVVTKYLKEIAARDQKIQILTKQGMESEDQTRSERERAETAETKAEALEKENTELNEHIGRLNAALLNKDVELSQKDARIEEELKESRFHRNETARIMLKLQTVESEVELLRKQKQDIPRNEQADDIAARIAERTANKRKQLANVRKNEDGSITGVNAQGEEETVPWFAIKSVEEVESFLPIPEIEGIDEHVSSGIYQGIPQSDMGDRGREDQVESVSNAEESYTLPTNESAEAAQEAQDREEVGETPSANFVTRKELETAFNRLFNEICNVKDFVGMSYEQSQETEAA